MPVLALLCILLTAGSAFGGETADAAWPLLTAPLATATPTIDGKLAAGEWDAAVTVPGFVVLKQGGLIANQPLVRAAWSTQALLVAASVPLPPGQRAKATATDFDGTVWNDDSVEVHLDRGHQHKQNHQFVVNALGTRLDSLAGDPKWNGPWQAQAENTLGRWSCEFAIPWSTVGTTPKSGDLDGFNVIINSSYLGGTLTFAPLKSSAHETLSFAHLRYGTTALSLEGLDAAVREIMTRPVGNAPVEVSYALSSGGRVLDQRTVSGSAPTAIPIALPKEAEGGVTPGTYTIALRATSGGQPLLARQSSLTIGEPLRVELAAFTQEQHLDLYLRPEQAVFPDARTKYFIRLSGPHGFDKSWRHMRETGHNAASPDLRIEGKDLPEGKLTFSVTASVEGGGVTRTVERVLEENPLRPVWLGTKEGLTDEVPAPWTPLVFDAKNHAVRCSGRAYVFDRGPLPAQVKTREVSILAAPITFTGKVGGQSLEWTSGGYNTFDVGQAKITLDGRANAGEGEKRALRLEGRTGVDYDGMMRVDLTLTPGQPGARCDELTLQIPLNTANARYLYHFPGRWGSVDNSGFVPRNGWSHAFKPYVWLGDEDRGFSWFCESDENWFPVNNPKALTVDVEGPITYLRCRLIATPMRLDEPLKYTFGFQATPVKQPDRTVWDYRITHHGNYGLEKEMMVSGGKVSYPAAGHIRREEGTFECWVRPAVDSERDKTFAERTHQGNRDLFSVQLSPGMNGSNYGLYWNGTVQGLVAWARTDGVVTDNPNYSFDWKAGQWHHVGMTWDRERLRLYLDGRMVSEAPNKGFLAAPLEQAQIFIGGDGALATIDEVRILSVARPPVVPEKAHVQDEQTLLLDDFEAYGGSREPGTGNRGKTAAGGTRAPRAEEARGEGPSISRPVGMADAWLKFIPGKFGLAPTWEPAMGQTRLAQLAEKGVRTVCFHEHWVPYQSYPHVAEADRPKLRSLVDGMHASKLNLLLYMSRQFADNAPEWELYNKEACLEPRPAPYTRYPVQKAYLACWKGPYRDFALHWLGRTMDEFGNDGWYLDGPEWPMPCANRSHGCGYVAADGSVRPTWDIFATREFMQRLYVLTRSRKPHGQLNIHNSTVMVTPTLGFGTSSWGGEQIDVIKPPAKTLDFLPMDAMRTEFMGRQWGIPAEFLVYDGMPYYAKDVLAYTLLHGVLIRPGSPDSIDRISALWKVHDEFPFSHAEMLGYWANADVVQIAGSPSGSLSGEAGQGAVYATAWRLPQKGSLIVVSNLTETDAQARLTLNLGKLGGKRIVDALTGEALTHQGGRLALPVESWRYRVLRIRP